MCFDKSHGLLWKYRVVETSKATLDTCSRGSWEGVTSGRIELHLALFWDGESGVALSFLPLENPDRRRFPFPLEKNLCTMLVGGDTYGSRASRPGGS